MSEVIALNPKIYSCNYQKIKDENLIALDNKKVLKGGYIYQKLSDDVTVDPLPLASLVLPLVVPVFPFPLS